MNVGQFKSGAPELDSPVAMDNLRRVQLFKIACDRGLVRKDQATPTKPQLLRIIEDNIVVVDVKKLSPDNAPVPLNSAHLPQEPTPVIAETEGAEDFDIFGENKDTNQILNEFMSVNQVPKLLSMFKKQFPDREGTPKSVPKGFKKATLIEWVKEELGIV